MRSDEGFKARWGWKPVYARLTMKAAVTGGVADEDAVTVAVYLRLRGSSLRRAAARRLPLRIIKLSPRTIFSWTIILGSRTFEITFRALALKEGLLTLMSAARAGDCGTGTGAFRMDMSGVVGVRFGAAETFCLLWVILERGIAHCFSLAGSLRMIMRGDERGWGGEGDDKCVF